LGAEDAFLIKYDSAGNLQWSKQFGTSSADFAKANTVDASGNVFVGGSTQGTMGQANAGDYDAILGKFDSAGNPLWFRQIGTNQFDETLGIALDSSGNPYIAGQTYDSLFGPGTSEDPFLAKFSPVVVPEASSFFLLAIGSSVL